MNRFAEPVFVPPGLWNSFARDTWLDIKCTIRRPDMLDQHDGRFERDRARPNRGSVTLEHRLGATGGACGLCQAVKALWTMSPGSQAIISICADVGLCAAALLDRGELEINAMTSIRLQLSEMRYDN